MCSIEECTNKVLARGWCRKHYYRWYKYGDPTTTLRAMTIEDAMTRYTKPGEGGCTEWTGTITSAGYGNVKYQGRMWQAHRVAWVLDGKELKDTDLINHRCWNKICVNVEHLEVVTRSQNGMYKSGPQRNNTSGYRNVYANGSGWVAAVTKTIDGVKKKFHAPTRKTIEEAVKDAEELRQEHFGKYAGRG